MYKRIILYTSIYICIYKQKQNYLFFLYLNLHCNIQIWKPKQYNFILVASAYLTRLLSPVTDLGKTIIATDTFWEETLDTVKPSANWTVLFVLSPVKSVVNHCTPVDQHRTLSHHRKSSTLIVAQLTTRGSDFTISQCLFELWSSATTSYIISWTLFSNLF